MLLFSVVKMAFVQDTMLESEDPSWSLQETPQRDTSGRHHDYIRVPTQSDAEEGNSTATGNSFDRFDGQPSSGSNQDTEHPG